MIAGRNDSELYVQPSANHYCIEPNPGSATRVCSPVLIVTVSNQTLDLHCVSIIAAVLCIILDHQIEQNFLQLEH